MPGIKVGVVLTGKVFFVAGFGVVLPGIKVGVVLTGKVFFVVGFGSFVVVGLAEVIWVLGVGIEKFPRVDSVVENMNFDTVDTITEKKQKKSF